MTKIAFIGLGNMGGGMAANQAKAGHAVKAFDLSQAALDRAKDNGCEPVGSVVEAVKDADIVVTMLPAGPHVLKVYSEEIIGAAPTSGPLRRGTGASTATPVISRNRASSPAERFFGSHSLYRAVSCAS